MDLLTERADPLIEVARSVDPESLTMYTHAFDAFVDCKQKK